MQRRLLLTALFVLTAWSPIAHPVSTFAVVPRTQLEFRHGVAFPVWWHDLYASTGANRALADASHSGINAIQLVTTWYVDSPTAWRIYPHPHRSVSDKSLEHAVATARRLGLRVMLKLHVDVLDGTWRGEIAPADEDAWLRSFTYMVLHYAKFAGRHELDGLILGAELPALTTAAHTDRWRRLISEVRAHFGGLLSYAANWDEYGAIGFWDRLDFVGVDAYFPLIDLKYTSDPSFPDIVRAWHGVLGKHSFGPWALDLDRFAAPLQKPIIFTEIGYRSQDGAAYEPWQSDSGLSPNLDLQRRLYGAVYTVFTPKPYFAGIYWWRWDIEPERQGRHAMTPQGKPAEDVMRAWGERLKTRSK